MPRKARFLRQKQWWYKFALPLVLVALGPSLYGVWRIQGLAGDGKQAHDALCVLRGREAQRVKDTEDFIKSHPQGFDGITVAQLESEAARDQATLVALQRLGDCPERKE